MQGYGAGFAKSYNKRLVGYAKKLGPDLMAYCNTNQFGKDSKVLDLCCGTGHLARYFLERGYRVTGSDLSEAMLDLAREKNKDYIDAGQARFFQADAARIETDERYDLVFSTYDALNLLPDLDDLKSCFQCVFKVMTERSMFVFDLVTRRCLRLYDGVNYKSFPNSVVMNRALYDSENDKVYVQYAGFEEAGDGLYERYEESVIHTVFNMADVEAALLEAGFSHVYTSAELKFGIPIPDPERLNRAYFIARKGSTEPKPEEG